MKEYGELRTLLGAIDDLHRAAQVLEWDQETYMPGGAVAARIRQVATLRKLAHEQFTDDRVGVLLDRLAGLDLNEWGADLVAVTRRDYDRARRIPPHLIRDLALASGQAREAWRMARSTNDFQRFAPYLERILALTIEKAEALGYAVCRYDALLDEYEPGMRTSVVQSLFASLRRDLVPIVQAIARCDRPDTTFLRQAFDSEVQWAFGMDVLRKLGYDLMRGRQDVSAHPFSTSFSIDDVRITTRLHERSLPSALFSTMHEAGHALYEQGIDAALENTPLAEGASLGLHESQSRLWENLVGRSRSFWEYWYPDLRERFRDQLGVVSLDAFYRAVNCVTPAAIRVEADEVTYNLHIMLRFDLEQAMVDQQVAVQDLPALWNAKMEEYLGVRPGSDTEGVLQDIHWALGAIGYFPTYALGNLMSAQIFACARAALPDLDHSMARGDYTDLLAWLRTGIYRFGRSRSAAALIGEQLSAAPWLAYVRRKYEALYPLQS